MGQLECDDVRIHVEGLTKIVTNIQNDRVEDCANEGPSLIVGEREHGLALSISRAWPEAYALGGRV